MLAMIFFFDLSGNKVFAFNYLLNYIFYVLFGIVLYFPILKRVDKYLHNEILFGNKKK